MLSTLRTKLLSSEEGGNNFLSSLEFQSCLGLGGFGIVLEAIDITSPTNPSTAVKFIFSSETDEKEEKQIVRECQLTSTLNHQNIVKILNVAGKQFKANGIEKIFKNVFRKDERFLLFRDLYIAKASRYKTVDSICIQMELCGENLRKWLHQEHDSAEEKVQGFQIRICRDIVAGLKYLHDKKIIHRDLKPENILFSAKQFTLPVKIGDFGLCRKLHSNPESQTGSLTSCNGTILYMAPEAFSNDYTLQVDLFSLGLVIWEVVQLIKFKDRRSLFDGLVNDRDEGVVQLPEIFKVLRESILNLTRKKKTERIEGLNEVIGTIQVIYESVAGFASTSEDLEICLRDVKNGGRIILDEGIFEGTFHLAVDGAQLVGQGIGKTIIKCIKNKRCLVVFGSGCIISGLTIIPFDGIAIYRLGIYLHGSRNRINNVEVVGGLTSIHVEGHKNMLENLTISNAYNEIEIHGSNNILNQIKIGCGIAVPPTSPNNFSPNIVCDAGVLIVVGGSHNSLSNIHLVKDNTDENKFLGMWLRYSGSNHTVSNLICSGYSWDKKESGLLMDASNSIIKDSDCGPILVRGDDSSFSFLNVNCGEFICIYKNATGLSLTKCRGQTLISHNPTVILDCQFNQIVNGGL